MATQVQFRRGTTTQNNAFTGAAGEITYDTDIKTLRLHDGLTQGGGAIVATLQATQTLLNKTHSTGSVWNGQVVGLLYGGTGGAITAVPGAIAYSTAIGFGLSLPGTSGQVLISGGTSAPSWVASTSLQAGNSVNASFATNVAGGSAGQLVIQQDNSLTTFITAGDAGTFLKSNGAGYAPGWTSGQVTFGSTTVTFGGTSTSLAGLTSIDSTSGATSFFASPASPTLFSTGTAITIGSASGTLTLRNPTIVGANTTQTLFNTVATTVNAFGASTLTTIGASTGTHQINNAALVHNSTAATKIAVGTTAQRPASVTGQIRYNSDLSTFEGFGASSWGSLGGVKSVDGLTYILAETSAGSSNDELEFYASNNTTAVKVGGWNISRLLEATGTVLGTQTTQNLFNTVATTLNVGGAATTISLGAATGTTTVNTTTLAAKAITASTTLGVTGNATVGGTLGVTGATTLSSTLNAGASTLASASITGAATVGSTLGVTGNTTVGGTLGVTGLITSTAGISGGPAAHTTGSFSGVTSITNNTAASSAVTGALVVTGGVGIGGAVYVGGTLNVAGNLSVSGTTTTTNSQSLTVTTPQLFLASDNAANVTDVGLLGGYTSGTAKKMGLIKQASSGEWRLFSNGTGAPGTTYDFTGVTYDVLRLGGIINTGNNTIAGTLGVSGATTLAGLSATTGSFSSTLGVSGATTLAGLSATTGSFSSTLGVSGNTTVGGTLGVTGLITSTAGISGGPATHTTGSFSGTLGVTGLITASGGLSGNTSGTHTGAVVGNADTATKLATARTIAFTGDATGTGTFDGSANYSAALTLASSGVAAGTYTSSTITVDAKGRITSASSGAAISGSSANAANTLVQRDASGNSYHGTLFAAAHQVTSDVRLKSNVDNSSYGLNEILQLRSVQYDKNNKHEIGLIAQEVDPIMPEFVDETADGMKTVNYAQMVSVLIKAVQELNAEVVSLKAQLGK